MMNGDMKGRWMLFGLLSVTAGTAGVGGAALASGGGMLQAMHHMAGHHDGPMDPAAMDAHFEKHLAEMVPDATPEQKARLKTLAARVHTEMGTIHGAFGETHLRAHALLLGPKVDRAGLEQLRAAQLRTFDGASKRLVAAFADAAEALTPEQRQRLAAKMQAKRH
jgi:protein CpxP